ncbi:lipase family protein [Agaribacterium sp. ZY112]|uniref:lipase family protein n=1 Tax=Agaribacterium sp. ZY112 TaxID=3233574 RepID=UPI003523685A
MTELSPTKASELATDIYAIQSERTAERFFKKDIFLTKTGNKLKAEVGSRLINTRDSFGACVHGAGQYKDDVFLIFRGSTTANYCADWVSNARIGLEIGETGNPVHIGFNHIFKSMLPQIKEFFQSNSNSKPRTVHCIGHSLGGAIATLAADWVAHFHKSIETKVYTFGAPRPATHLFARKHTNTLSKNNIYRVYHESDPVPMIPVFPFCHSPFLAIGHFIHTKPMVWPWDHKMGAYIKSVNAKGKSWLKLAPNGVHEPTEKQMQQWLESNIQVQPSSTKAWQWISSALFYVLRKIVGFSLAKLQGLFIGAVTLADNIAAILKKGLDMDDGNNTGGPTAGATVSSHPISFWIRRLMVKITDMLGWGIQASANSLSQSFMKRALKELIDLSTLEASKAVRGLAT